MPRPGEGFGNVSSGDTYIPFLNFDTLSDLFINLQSTCNNLWISLNKPFYSFLEDLMVGDGTGVISKLFQSIFSALSLTNLDTFLNQFTTLSFLFGSGLVFAVGYSFLKFLKL